MHEPGLTPPPAGTCLKGANGSNVSPGPRPDGIVTSFPLTGSGVMTALVPSDDNSVSSVRGWFRMRAGA
jgi:hypothetical protein